MRVEWSDKALADARRIAATIEANNRSAALAVVARIERRVALLSDFQEIGRPGRASRTRELVIQRTPYIVIYRLCKDAATVVGIVHGKRRYPARRRR